MKKVGLAVVAVAGGLLTVGCGNGKVTGGGSLQGFGGDRGTFAVVFDACKGMDQAKGNFVYRDKNSGVAVKGKLIALSPALAGECNFVNSIGGMGYSGVSYVAAASWESTNPKQPGKGLALICTSDNGERGKIDAADFVAIGLWQGDPSGVGPTNNVSTPFHVNGGTLKGNMQAHGCNGDPVDPVDSIDPLP